MPDLVVRRVWSAFVRYRRLPVGPDSGRITYMCGHAVDIETRVCDVAYDYDLKRHLYESL